MYRRTRAMLALATCTAGLALLPASALADTTDDPVVDVESPIQADEGTVLAETLHPDVTPAGEATCAAPELSTPLTAFKDRRDYFVAPGGDFENPALPGWQLSGGATVTGGNSTHAVLGDGHGASLLLPPGSTATSPEMCVDLNYPTFRFFATQLTEDADAELAVDVIYPALTRNNVREAKRFKLKAKDGWRLSDDIKLEPQRLGKQAGWRKVAIRVRVKPAKNPGSYRVDDLLIDPRRFN